MNQWIDVNDRMPDRDSEDTEYTVHVIVWSEIDQVMSLGYYDYTYETWHAEDTYYVSHWQPLPAPPTPINHEHESDR